MDFGSVSHFIEYTQNNVNIPSALEIWDIISSSFSGVVGALEGFAKFVPEVIISALITAFIIRLAVRFIF